MLLGLMCNESYGRVDGIRDYTMMLAHVIEGSGISVRLFLRDQTRKWRRRDGASAKESSLNLMEGLLECDAVVLQYQPFMYGLWGFAPRLLRTMSALRNSADPPRIAIMVHEMYVDMDSPARILMGLWQRFQLHWLCRVADVVFVSTGRWAQGLSRQFPTKTVLHLPVGSNVPDMAKWRVRQRSHLGFGEGTIVLATLGGSHPTRSLQYIAQAASALATSHDDVALLNLGANAPHLDIDPVVRVLSPGELSADEMGKWLSAADIYLAAFNDGVSTRRTSLMCAFAQGLPVVGLCGTSTDTIMQQAADTVSLVPVGRIDLFAEAVKRLADTPQSRVDQGQRGKILYAKEFDWSVIASRMIASLEDLQVGGATRTPSGQDRVHAESPSAFQTQRENAEGTSTRV